MPDVPEDVIRRNPSDSKVRRKVQSRESISLLGGPVLPVVYLTRAGMSVQSISFFEINLTRCYN